MNSKEVSPLAYLLTKLNMKGLLWFEPAFYTRKFKGRYYTNRIFDKITNDVISSMRNLSSKTILFWLYLVVLYGVGHSRAT